MTSPIAITGATGNIGKEIIRILSQQGIPVRAIARTEKTLSGLKNSFVETIAADLSDPAALTNAFKGTSAVFTMIPPNYTAPNFRTYQNSIADSFVNALQDAKVSHVVNLSSLGAEVGHDTGPINGLFDAEKKLNALSNLNIVHLRPTYFMENHLFSIGLIKQQSINGSPIEPNLTFPMIATCDIAAVAAQLLHSRSFTSISVQELLGPKDYSMVETTKILGKAIGKPELPYVQFPYEATEHALLSMGFSADVAKLFIEMYRGFNNGIIKSMKGRTNASTTPTTLEQFSSTFVSAYNS